MERTSLIGTTLSGAARTECFAVAIASVTLSNTCVSIASNSGSTSAVNVSSQSYRYDFILLVVRTRSPAEEQPPFAGSPLSRRMTKYRTESHSLAAVGASGYVAAM
uniref:Uncharacterized protein n=1 Tax=Odontella aurita TaxID=265563 RepID=A0A7S4HI82_9STRA|mmetsp:Transcript_104/g.178  ORF Transcript_104/g.178 Transcript_104/m.178 type:complete len:106 (+) Transcript_104:218-535(+)